MDEETDVIQEKDCYSIWDQAEKSDEAEIKQFVDTGSFEKSHVTAITEETVVVDSVWVRKWKRYPDGSRQVKSRLCARGCFDSQKAALSTRSTTATRLSQRLLLSTAANYDLEVESFDISGAFLKGLTFEKVRELLQSKGIHAPFRKVALIVPANAPLAWQLCLHGFLEEYGGTPSLLDENCFIWRNKEGALEAMVTTHVDDLGNAATGVWLEWLYKLLVAKFGRVTRQQAPFEHCGILYTKTADGYKMSQDSFCAKLKTCTIPTNRRDEDFLDSSELTMFRSLLGGLLWLTASRLDLISDVCLLQSQVTRAKVLHLRQANKVIKKAQAELGQGLGLHFRKLRSPMRLMCIHDSSAAGNVRNYAQEGVLVLLCEDQMKSDNEHEYILEDNQTGILGGKAHILWGHGAKAKRISYSTSHAETLAAVSGLEASTLVSVRLAEILFSRQKPTLQSLIIAQEGGIPQLPVDDLTDCRDFFELASGDRSTPQDKNQRLYVLSFREAQLTGRIRYLVLVPTQSMTADPLMKSMLSPPLMELLSSGTVSFANEQRPQDYTSQDAGCSLRQGGGPGQVGRRAHQGGHNSGNGRASLQTSANLLFPTGGFLSYYGNCGRYNIYINVYANDGIKHMGYYISYLLYVFLKYYLHVFDAYIIRV